MKRIYSLLALLFFLAPLAAHGQEVKNTPQAASTPAAFADLWGKTVAPLRFSDRSATVCLFIVRDCPIANAYAPEINRIIADFAGRKIGFFLVYVDSDVSMTDLRQHYKEYGYRCAAVYDKERRLVSLWKAARTPEVVVTDRTGKVIYQGRIDDQYVDFGKARHLAGQRDLRQVLDSVVAGRTITPITTPVIGCPIPE